VAPGVIREGERPRGLKRLWLASQNSLRGLANCYRSEAAFRQEAWLGVLVVPAALWLGRSGIERALLVGSYVLVLIVELLNTGIEVVVDRIGLERHPLSGLAKDVGSAEVLLALALLATTWALVLFDRPALFD
jgi:diacylglycerol kinase (ATP)